MEEMNILFTGPIFVHGQQKMLKELAASDPELYHAVRLASSSLINPSFFCSRLTPPSFDLLQMEIGDRATIERKRGHAASKQTEHREHA